jgi:hypothetical protein
VSRILHRQLCTSATTVRILYGDGPSQLRVSKSEKIALMKNHPVLARDKTGEFMHSLNLREGPALHINAVTQLRCNAVVSPAFALWDGAGLALEAHGKTTPARKESSP